MKNIVGKAGMDKNAKLMNCCIPAAIKRGNGQLRPPIISIIWGPFVGRLKFIV
jgi:hypothetical protein